MKSIDSVIFRVISILLMLNLECSTSFTPAGTGLAGMRQKDLIQWYVSQQNEKNNYSSMEEAAAEVTKVKAIIEVTLQIFMQYNGLLD